MRGSCVSIAACGVETTSSFSDGSSDKLSAESPYYTM
jgi:hypothetical protein